MDYLNIAKTRRHYYVLMVGYVLIAVAITTSALVLLELAYGFGLGKNGSVIQKGLIFFSSQPHPASIYINGKLNSNQTNSQLLLPENVYQVKLSRNGYRDWQRTIDLNGGSVEHFDYPLLFPKSLVTTDLHNYTASTGLFTQSPDRRWLLVEQPGSITDFDLYDLKNPTKAPVTLSLPATLLSKANSSESWQMGEWADDNQHLLLQHNYDGKSEFILFDRNDPTQSVNLNNQLAVNPTSIALNNKKYNQYYIYDATAATLGTASLSSPTVTPRLTHVLAYKSYGSDTVLYVTDDAAPKAKVLVKLSNGSQTTQLRTLPAGDNYLINLTQYNGVPYVVIGAAGLNKVYIYQDPVAQLTAEPDHAIVPIQVLDVEQPNYLSFSTNAQFIVVENGQHFGVYDIEDKLGYNYTATAPLDAPQSHATWMDGDRLTYVSNGRLEVADYDGTNPQSLMPANSSYLPVFDPNFHFVYSLVTDAANNQLQLTQTSLLIPADQ